VRGIVLDLRDAGIVECEVREGGRHVAGGAVAAARTEEGAKAFQLERAERERVIVQGERPVLVADEVELPFNCRNSRIRSR